MAPNTCKIIHLRIDLIDLRVIHACEWLLRNPTRPSSVLNFKEYLINATVFSELAHHTETKMTIFTIGPLPRPLQGFRLFSRKSARRPRLLTSTKIKLFSRLFCAECRVLLITAVTGVLGELETSDKFSNEFTGVEIIFKIFTLAC